MFHFILRHPLIICKATKLACLRVEYWALQLLVVWTRVVSRVVVSQCYALNNINVQQKYSYICENILLKLVFTLINWLCFNCILIFFYLIIYRYRFYFLSCTYFTSFMFLGCVIWRSEESFLIRVALCPRGIPISRLNRLGSALCSPTRRRT